MMLLPDSPTNPYVNFGLNNIVARETRVETKPKFLVDNTSQRPSTPTERLKNLAWPTLKKVSSNLAETTKIARKGHENQPSTSTQPMLSKQAVRQSFTERRGVVLPELGKPSMPAVEGPRVDSPTIPGRFFIHGRSRSAPEQRTNRTLFESSIQQPISQPMILSSQPNAQVKPEDIKDMPKGVHAAGYTPRFNMFSQKSAVMGTLEEDRPPAVPPKSPRLVNRQITTLKNESGTHIATPKPHSIRSRPRAATATEIGPRRHVAQMYRYEENQPAVTMSSAKTKQPKAKQIGTKHKQGQEALVRKNSSRSKRRSLLGSKVVITEKSNYTQLPKGFDVPDAKSQLSSSDVEILRKQAKTQAEKFRVLKYHEVKALSKELRYLDERCAHLRNTIRSERNHLHEYVMTLLRSSRSITNGRQSILGQEKEALMKLDRAVDDRMVALEQLDNRRTRVRQMLLEHIAASLILSGAYDPNDATQKEITGINNDINNSLNDDKNKNDDAASCVNVPRESIKIYADCGVYGDADVTDLLADIEQQMETMAKPPQHTLLLSELK